MSEQQGRLSEIGLPGVGAEGGEVDLGCGKEGLPPGVSPAPVAGILPTWPRYSEACGAGMAPERARIAMSRLTAELGLVSEMSGSLTDDPVYTATGRAGEAAAPASPSTSSRRSWPAA